MSLCFTLTWDSTSRNGQPQGYVVAWMCAATPFPQKKPPLGSPVKMVFRRFLSKIKTIYLRCDISSFLFARNSPFLIETFCGRSIRYIMANPDHQLIKKVCLSIVRKLHGHSHIVQFHGVSFREKDVAFIFEKCTGSLADYIFRDKKTLVSTESTKHSAIPEKFQWAREIIDGLVFIHAQNVVHSNLKPENILVWTIIEIICIPIYTLLDQITDTEKNYTLWIFLARLDY